MKSTNIFTLIAGILLGIAGTIGFCRFTPTAKFCQQAAPVTQQVKDTMPRLVGFDGLNGTPVFAAPGDSSGIRVPSKAMLPWAITVLAEERTGTPISGAKVMVPCFDNSPHLTNKDGLVLLWGYEDLCPCTAEHKISATTESGLSGSVMMTSGCASYTVVLN